MVDRLLIWLLIRKTQDMRASVVAARGLSGSGARLVACGMWIFPGL